MKSKKRSARQYICFVIFVIVALINIYQHGRLETLADIFLTQLFFQ